MATQHIKNIGIQGSQPEQSEGEQKGFFARFAHHLGNFLLNQWASVITAVLGLLVFIALSIPFLSYFGLDTIAKPLFFSLHYVCAQIPSHSFYIFGHQLGLCERNLSIYSSMFVGSLVFVLSKKRLPGIPWWLWILLMLPMAWDGFTQMFGWRESTWILRIVTGTLFGLGNVWFALPLMQKAMLEPTAVPPHRVALSKKPSTQPTHNAL
ncbi:DUF2085 domain-containing protein [Ktedonosporobacter rubrisoli]|uniref:DUF2085 domain-containing protein n=1 Tax=Ktedonosporobacter rubrisoli TaxID=2509675 RepID=A0A4P6JS89_KTERU|nr:DUF2085 domain-containing protein [Ktedonosporobacter rubrisoli]QBD78062.1 DUF2085 domain-containing protein [Ktedonosporobacter rubrisoli]